MRDDAERAIAISVGATPAAHNKAIATAQHIQRAMSGSASEKAAAAQNYVVGTTCTTGQERTGVTTAEQEMLNSRARQKAMIEAYVALIDATVASIESTGEIANPVCAETP